MQPQAPQAAGPSGERAGRRAFTLIELLTVVAIIGLLVGMVVPTIQSILETLIDAETRVRIQSLVAGVQMYKIHATGNRYFPGQDEDGKRRIESGDYKNAASAFLGRCLFTDPNGLFPVEAYAPLEPGMIDRDTSKTRKAGTIRDTVNPQMAILYYPARLKDRNKKDQFIREDNKTYTDGNSYTPPGGSIRTLYDVLPADMSKSPVNGQYILWGAGKDRWYWSDDDRRNFR